MRKEDKAALVDEIADRLGDAEAIFAIDYRGITVPQAAELRAKLAEAETSFRVVKNRLAKRATERAGTAELDPLFQGPTALAFVKGDAVAAAKAISTFGRQHDILAYKGGLMDGAPLDPDQFMTIARLPALDVLHGQLAGVVASPLTGLARGLGAMVSGLAVALGQIQEQGLVGEGKETEETAKEELEETAKEEPAGASDEVAEGAAEPAAPPEPEPAGSAGEAEQPAADEVAEGAAEPADASESDDSSGSDETSESESDDTSESESDDTSQSESEDTPETEPNEEE